MRFLLSGYYGFGNLGDEALLEVIVQQLRARFPSCEIDVLSAQPAVTARELKVDATPRMDMRRVRDSIERADVLISGGGGLLQSATSLRSVMYYAGIIRSAVRADRKAMIFAQSIGPLDFFGKRIVREWCKGVDRATVRDARSYQLLSSLLPLTPSEQTADPVFLYDAPDEEIDLSAEGLGPDSEPFVVVSVRKAKGMKEGLDVVARAVDRLHEVHNARVAFLPIGGDEDAEVSLLVARKCNTAPVLLPATTLARAANIIRRAKAVVGMRLHALILAARYGVPFLAIPYDPKVFALVEDLAYPLPPLFVPGATKPSPEQTDALVDRLWSERATLGTHLSERITDVQALAARNFEVLAELADEQRPSPR